MASINKVILVGNLGADPETRYTPNGDQVTNIRLATTDKWKGDGKQRQLNVNAKGVVPIGSVTLDGTFSYSDRAEQDYQRKREERFRDTSESTNARVLWWAVAQSVVLLIAAATAGARVCGGREVRQLDWWCRNSCCSGGIDVDDERRHRVWRRRSGRARAGHGAERGGGRLW